ncbi:MAG: hypothetical protein ACYDAZ_00935 [Thermoplasmataceae archaeon]
MRNIKIVERIESSYKVKTIALVSLIATFLMTEQYISIYSFATFSHNLVAYFQQSSTLSFYGNIIGLLLAAYAVMVTLVPNFSAESLQMPIFSQINRLFLFTILDGIMMMILSFAQGIFPSQNLLVYQGVPLFTAVEIFFFLSLIIGLIFCVLTLSQLFHLVRNKGEKRHSRPK